MHLRIHYPDGQARCLLLELNKATVIGSRASCDLTLPGEGVHPLHCGISWSDERFVIRSYHLGELISVNGELLDRTELSEGDTLEIGPYRLELISDEAAEKFGEAGSVTVDYFSLALAPSLSGIGVSGEDQSQRSAAASEDAGNEASAASSNQQEKQPPKPLSPTPKHASGSSPGQNPPSTQGDDLTIVPTADANDVQPMDLTSLADNQPTVKASAGFLAPQTDETFSLADESPDESSSTDQTSDDQTSDASSSKEPAANNSAVSSSGNALDPGGPGLFAGDGSAADLADLDQLTQELMRQDPASQLPVSTDPVSEGLGLTGGPPADGFGLATQGSGSRLPSGRLDHDLLGDPALGGPTPAPEAPRQPSALAKALTSSTSQAIFTGVMALAGLGVIWGVLSAQPTAEERFAAAVEHHRRGEYARAGEQLKAFLRAYPGAAQANEAEVWLGLTRLVPQFQSRQWPQILSGIEEVLDQWSGLGRHPLAQQELARILPETAIELVGRAETMVQDGLEADQAVEQAETAVTLACQFLPPTIQHENDLADLQRRLFELSRRRQEKLSLSKAVSAIDTALNSESFEEVYAARRQLLDEYPDLQSRSELLSLMRKVAQAEAARVQSQQVQRPAKTSEPPPPVPLLGTLSTQRPLAEVRTGGLNQTPAYQASQVSEVAASSKGGCITLALGGLGVVYGIDPAEGRLLWRRGVGPHAGFRPLALGPQNNPEGFVLIDFLREEVWRVDARTGRLVWRQAVPGILGSPVSRDDEVILASVDGQLMVLNAESGEIRHNYQFPHRLATEPVVDSNQTIYQLADEAYLYIIEPDHQVRTLYLGHPPGSVLSRPVLIGETLVVAQEGRNQTSLLAVNLSQNRPKVQSKELPGRLSDQLQVGGSVLIALTEQGQLLCFRASGNNREPLAEGPVTVVPATEQSPGGLSLQGDRLWVATRRLTSYSFPPRVSWKQLETLPIQGVALQPPVAAGQHLVLATQLDLQKHSSRLSGSNHFLGGKALGDRLPAGVRVLGWQNIAGEWRASWQTELAMPLAAPPLPVNQGAAVLAVHPGGDIFLLELDDPSLAEAPQPLISAGGLTESFDTDGRLWEFPENIVLAPSAGGHQLLAIRLKDAAVEVVNLPGRLGGRPIRWGDHLFVALHPGPAYLLDPKTLAPAGPPFWPPLSLRDPGYWGRPTLVAEGQLGVAFGETLYWLRQQGGAPVVARTERSSGDSWAAPVVIGDQRFREIAPPDNADAGGPLLARSATLLWSGRSAAVLRGADGSIWCCQADGTCRWRRPPGLGRVIGLVPLNERHFVVATREGSLALWSRETGQQVGAVKEVCDLLAGPPVVAGSAVVVTSADGSVYALADAAKTLTAP